MLISNTPRGHTTNKGRVCLMFHKNVKFCLVRQIDTEALLHTRHLDTCQPRRYEFMEGTERTQDGILLLVVHAQTPTCNTRLTLIMSHKGCVKC